MTRQAALRELAVKVMDWEVLEAQEWWKLPMRLRVEGLLRTIILTDLGLCYPGTYKLGKDYDPWDEKNVYQAVELAEAWCAVGNQARSYKILSPCPWSELPKFRVSIFQQMGCAKQWKSEGDSLGDALTGAVCEAEDIEVEEKT